MSTPKNTNIPNWPVKRLDNDNIIDLLSLLEGKRGMVLDFWTSKCVKCPGALDKLNSKALSYPDIAFISCALSQGDGNVDIVKELVDEGSWENLTNVFLEIEHKENAKALFGFAQVPFCLVINTDGTVLQAGDPKSIDFDSALASCTFNSSSEENKNSVETNRNFAQLVLDEDF